MNLVNFLSGVFHWKSTEKTRPVPRRTETTQQAAARALRHMFSEARGGTKR